MERRNSTKNGGLSPTPQETTINLPVSSNRRASSASILFAQASFDTGLDVSRASQLSSQRNVLSTHVMDLGSGRPCSGIQCKAFKWDKSHSEWIQIGDTVTNAQGRIPLVHPGTSLSKGLYKLRFATKEYYARHQLKSLFPQVDVVIEVDDASEHCHVPVLLNHFGYSVYKGH
ncbi:hypothetical protein niasHS_012101 [Heterodera schachtii]|uniref:hydroxyisourate hydrolase n=1 Tax=Heterodera schachtii TaxID=97005 RepID=A0ABD2ID75_HETSC